MEFLTSFQLLLDSLNKLLKPTWIRVENLKKAIWGDLQVIYIQPRRYASTAKAHYTLYTKTLRLNHGILCNFSQTCCVIKLHTLLFSIIIACDRKFNEALNFRLYRIKIHRIISGYPHIIIILKKCRELVSFCMKNLVGDGVFQKTTSCS